MRRACMHHASTTHCMSMWALQRTSHRPLSLTFPTIAYGGTLDRNLPPVVISEDRRQGEDTGGANITPLKFSRSNICFAATCQRLQTTHSCDKPLCSYKKSECGCCRLRVGIDEQLEVIA